MLRVKTAHFAPVAFDEDGGIEKAGQTTRLTTGCHPVKEVQH